MGVGAVEPKSSLPWVLPWRALIVGSLAEVTQSTLVDDLAPPSVVADTSWIHPGRASWSWWSDDDSPKDEAKLKDRGPHSRFVHIASHGFFRGLDRRLLRRLLRRPSPDDARLDPFFHDVFVFHKFLIDATLAPRKNFCPD